MKAWPTGIFNITWRPIYKKSDNTVRFVLERVYNPVRKKVRLEVIRKETLIFLKYVKLEYVKLAHVDF